jgi:hypothetical protein
MKRFINNRHFQVIKMEQTLVEKVDDVKENEVVLDVDIREFSPHRYDRSLDAVGYLLQRAKIGHATRTMEGNGQPPLSFHLVSWDTEKFTIYMPKYDWLYYEPEGDLFLNLISQEHNKGYSNLGRLCDLVHIQENIKEQKVSAKQKDNQIEFLAYHMTPVMHMDRTYKVLHKVQYKD